MAEQNQSLFPPHAKFNADIFGLVTLRVAFLQMVTWGPSLTYFVASADIQSANWRKGENMVLAPSVMMCYRHDSYRHFAGQK